MNSLSYVKKVVGALYEGCRNNTTLIPTIFYFCRDLSDKIYYDISNVFLEVR